MKLSRDGGDGQGAQGGAAERRAPPFRGSSLIRGAHPPPHTPVEFRFLRVPSSARPPPRRPEAGGTFAKARSMRRWAKVAVMSLVSLTISALAPRANALLRPASVRGLRQLPGLRAAGGNFKTPCGGGGGLTVVRCLGKSSRAERKAAERAEKRRKRAGGKAASRDSAREAENILANLPSLQASPAVDQEKAIRRLCQLRRPTSALRLLRALSPDGAVRLDLAASLASALAKDAPRPLEALPRRPGQPRSSDRAAKRLEQQRREDHRAELDKWMGPLAELLAAAEESFAAPERDADAERLLLRVAASAARAGLASEGLAAAGAQIKAAREGVVGEDQSALWRRRTRVAPVIRNAASAYAVKGDAVSASGCLRTLGEWTQAWRAWLLEELEREGGEGRRAEADWASGEGEGEGEGEEAEGDAAFAEEEPTDASALEARADEQAAAAGEEAAPSDLDAFRGAAFDLSQVASNGVGLSLLPDALAARLILKLGRLGSPRGVVHALRAAGCASSIAGVPLRSQVPVLLPGARLDIAKSARGRQLLGVGAEAQRAVALSLCRSVDFVKGAVSVETLPAEPRQPEIAFVGRSNVGKSSLINMLTARSALAYSSKTPGKTQQFNFFNVNAAANSGMRFCLVDLPGYGYAKVPKAERMDWLNFTERFISGESREGGSRLAAFMHLIDGRHGPVGQDEEMMRLFLDASRDTHARYVVVLTKLDKRNAERRIPGAVRAAREALARAGHPSPDEVPIVASSAASRVGRDALWVELWESLSAYEERRAGAD